MALTNIPTDYETLAYYYNLKHEEIGRLEKQIQKLARENAQLRSQCECQEDELTMWRKGELDDQDD